MPPHESNVVELSPSRRRALELVAAGKVEYSLSMGCWEPQEGYRLPAFDWLDEHRLIEPEYDAAPQGRVTQRVPVRLTDAGLAALR